MPDGNSALLKSSASTGLPLVGVAAQEMVKSPAGASEYSITVDSNPVA